MELKQTRFAPTKSLEAWTKFEIHGWFKEPLYGWQHWLSNLRLSNVYL